jgi:N-acetylglucosamine kinase-like BadF-type ATPase
MQYLLAADGGGTKTHVICADETGATVGEGFSGPTSLASVTPGAASFNLREAVRQSVQNLPAGSLISLLMMGLAGMDTQAEAETARTVFTQVLQDFPIQRLDLVNDTEIALATGTQAADAVVLISGTGSNCFGRNAAGTTAKSGGLDYLLTDQGSGYAIGRSVLRAAVKSYDGRSARTELEQYVCEHFRIASVAELKDKVHSPLLTKTEIAELSQVCLRAFDQGDEVAKQIFDQAIAELGLMARAVLQRLDLLGKPVECVMAGSITKLAYIQTGIQQQLTQLSPAAKIVIPTQAPVHGAVMMGLQRLKTATSA